MSTSAQQWIYRSSVRSRLFLAFTVILALLFVVAGIAFERLNLLDRNMHDLVEIKTKNAHQTQQLYVYSQASAIDLLRILQAEEREHRIPLYASMDMAIQRADSALSALQKSVIDRELINPVSQIRQLYLKEFYSTVEMLEIDSLNAARHHFETRTEPVLQQLLNHTMSLDAQHTSDMEQQALSLQEETDKARLLITIIGVSSLLVGLVLAIIIARGISNPIGQAAKLATSIADGDYGAKLPRSRISELHILFKALSRMRSSILQREQRISRLAYNDTLTGLANRTRFLECLEDAIKQGPGALVIFNLNRFSSINNALGHRVGDQILEIIGTRFVEFCEERHCVARLDSDKFALILCEIEDKKNYLLSIEQILLSLKQPITVQGQKLDIDARAGIATFKKDETSVIHLMQMADTALDYAKSHYQNLAFADPCQEQEGHEQLSLLGEMHEALEQNHFQLYYQPKTSAQNGQTKGVEALIRWNHPERGMISPGLFIPFSEQTGFIRNLTPWVIKQSLSDLGEWFEQGIKLVVSINISTLDLTNPELATFVKSELEKTRIPPEYLCLEITESALMVEPEQALKHLQELATLGVKLAIDDYGTGQASLSYVKDLPVHELKIDRAFISNVDHQNKQAAIVGATILMCEQLGLDVVAEGVETPEEASWLQDKHCNLLQGFGIARPMPAAALLEWLNNSSV